MKNKDDGSFNGINFEFSMNPHMMHRIAHSIHGMGRGFGIKYWILMLVSKEPLTGSQMIDKIADMSFGFWRPSPGSIYTILKYLLQDGLLKVAEKNNKKYYSVTDKGKEYLDSSWFPWKSAAKFMNNDEVSNIKDTIETIDNLSEFLSEKPRTLTAENKKALKKINERLNRLLE